MMKLTTKLILLFLFSVGLYFSLSNVFAESILKTNLLGPNTTGIFVNPTTNKVYLISDILTDSDTDRHIIYDGQTDTSIDSFSVLTSGKGAINSNTNFLYLNHQKKVQVVDLKTNTLESSIAFNDIVSTIKFNPKTNKIYVALNENSSNPVGAINKGVAVVDATNNSIAVPNLSGSLIATVSMFAGRFIELDDISNVVYVGFTESKDILMYDGATNTLLRTLTLPLGELETISSIEFVEGKGGLYISTNVNRLIRMDTSNIRNSTEVKTTVLGAVSGQLLGGLTANPDTNKLYALNSDTKKLVILDLSNNTIKQQLDLQATGALGINKNTKTIYIAGKDSNGQNLLTVVKDDGTSGSGISTTPSPTPTPVVPPISIGTPIPIETPVPVESPIPSGTPISTACESSQDLKIRAEDLLFDLIDSMRSIARDIRVSRTHARRAIRFARRILRALDQQSTNCTEAIASLLDRLDNEIFELGELNHPGIDDALGGEIEPAFDELSEILETDCDRNGISDVCEI